MSACHMRANDEFIFDWNFFLSSSVSLFFVRGQIKYYGKKPFLQNEEKMLTPKREKKLPNARRQINWIRSVHARTRASRPHFAMRARATKQFLLLFFSYTYSAAWNNIFICTVYLSVYIFGVLSNVFFFFHLGYTHFYLNISCEF